jgi:hypothetical protein
MKQLLSLSLFLFFVPCLALAQYPSNGNQKITLGEQTTADGLIFRGVASIDTVTATSKITRANKQDTSAFLLLDTTTNLLWHYKTASNGWIQAGGGTSVTTFSAGSTGLTPSTATSGAVTLAGTLAVENGGTGSATKNFVDLSNTQTVGGAKTLTSALAGTSATFSGNVSVSGPEPKFSNSALNIFLYGGTTGDPAISFSRYDAVINNRGAKIQYVFNGASAQESGSLAFYTNPNTTGSGSLIERMRIANDGEIWIAGTTDRGAYNLQVNGTGVWGEGAYVNGSDANIKENIIDLDSSLNIVNNLKPVVFNYINASVNNDTKHLGFIAQDVYQTLENKDYLGSIVRSDGDTLSIAYSNIIPLLTKAIQEQNSLIKALEQRIINLENK